MLIPVTCPACGAELQARINEGENREFRQLTYYEQASCVGLRKAAGKVWEYKLTP